MEERDRVKRLIYNNCEDDELVMPSATVLVVPKANEYASGNCYEIFNRAGP